MRRLCSILKASTVLLPISPPCPLLNHYTLLTPVHSDAVMNRLASLKVAVYLRSGIDDHNATVVAAGVKALHALFVSPNGK